MAVQRTFSIIKPDAVAKNVIGKITTRFEDAGLKIVASKIKQLSKAEAEGFYAEHSERGFFGDLVAFMTSGPVVVQVLEGENAIALNRELMGATNPKEAAAGTIRAEAEIGKGFFRTCASIYLIVWLLVLAGLEWARPWELVGFVAFTILFLTYYASLWFESLPKSSRLLDVTAVVGFAAVILSALSYTGEGVEWAGAAWHVPNFLLSSLSLGAAMSGMLLGHWYLVAPELSLVPIKRLTGILLGALVAQGLLLALTVTPELGAVPALLEPRAAHLLVAYPYFLLGRVLAGLVGTFGLAALTMWLLREGSTQSATGFLYTAVMTVTVGELIARFLFLLTSVPV